MASRGKRRLDARVAAFGGPAPARAQAFPAPLRVLILSALLLLAVYTAFSAYRLKQSAAGDRPAGPNLAADANLLVARADAASARLSAALTLAAERLQHTPDQPLDAAEAALRSGRPAARAIAVVGEAGPLAIAGGQGLARAQWQEAVAAAGKSGRAYWIGRPEPASPLAYAVAAAPGSRGKTYLVAAFDPAELFAAAEANQVMALVGADGAVVDVRGAPAADGGAQTTLGLSPGTVQEAARTGDEIKGQLADGRALKGRALATADGALIAIAAAPTASLTGAARRDLADSAFAVLAPLAIGLVLSLMLMRQSRRIEEAQEGQAETERKFRMAVEGARCGIWEWRLDDDTVFMSDVTGAMLGWGGGGVAKADEVIARIAPEHRDRVRDALASARHYGAFDVSFRVPGPHGSAWIDARGQAVEDAGPTGHAAILGVALDVTEERMTEARAQAAETRLRDAIDAVSDAFVLWDKRGRLLICNNSYRTFFALDRRVLKPGASRELVQRVAEVAVRSWSDAGDGRRGVREAELVDGRWLQVSERRTAEGGMVMTAVDITAVKRQEETRRLNEEALQKAVDRLEESQRELTELAQKYEAEKTRAEGANRAKSDFLANMSHELRTPLNAIIGFSEMMSSEIYGPLGSPRYKEYSHDILSSGQHLLAVINDILDMSKIEAGKLQLRFQAVDVLDVAEDAVRLVRDKADEAGLRLICNVSPTLPEVRADYRALKQILLNLLSNAVKFTPRGGHVTVHAEVLHDPSGDRVRVEVRDTGIGISKEDLARLARPFEQVETQFAKTQQGTGLGLALVKSLVEMHGGVFSLVSEPGRGAVAALTLPLKAGSVEDGGEASAQAVA